MKKGCLSPTGYKLGVIGASADDWTAESTALTNSYMLKNGVAIKANGGGWCTQDTTLEKKVCSQNKPCAKPNRDYGTYYTSCMSIFVDINGPAGPNKTDIDAFRFVVVQNGIVPAGSAKEQIWTERFKDTCIKYQKYQTGKCTAWVIYNKNLDYLKCPEKLGWDKASSCK